MKRITLSDDQEKAFELLKSGKNVLVTGEAGTGKSTLINYYKQYLDSVDVDYVACAPTGVAAINIHGSTLHKTFRVPFGYLSKDDIEKKKPFNRVIAKAKVIIIDEISMCRSDLFDYVTTCIDQMCPTAGWCSGKQIIVIGDFFQLAPVISKQERQFFRGKSGFAFEGETWEKCNFRTVYLHKIIRQSDSEFINALNQARVGNSKCVKYFNRYIREYDDKSGITLCTKNSEAEKINDQHLSRLKGKKYKYTAAFTGDAGKGDFSGVEDLVLKNGARVMSLTNDSNGDYVNGTMGTVKSCTPTSVIVRWDNGKQSTIDNSTWEKYGYTTEKEEKIEQIPNPETGKLEDVVTEVERVKKEVTGTIVQIPLRLGYAITIHKSQGKTFNIVNTDLSNVFAKGQAYVALSRCSTPAGLHLKKKLWNGTFSASSEIINFYNDCEIHEQQIEEDEKKAEAIQKAKKEGKEQTAILIESVLAATIQKNASQENISVTEYLNALLNKNEKKTSVKNTASSYKA